MGIIKEGLKPALVQKHLYKTLARPVLRYGSEAWTIIRMWYQ